MKVQENAQQKSPEEKSRELLQWHPAFFAGIQIELKEDADNLIFEQEHSLSSKPMGIDVLIKKAQDIPIRKNIGRIFRKHNILEYKGPGDYLSIDDFYKVYGYACFYKSDVTSMDSIQLEELTISLICEHYPQKLAEHLKQERGYFLRVIEDGIYYIMGDKIPIQLIVTSRLSKKENLWLRSLTKHLENMDAARALLEDYKKNKKNRLYKSVMNVIVRANTTEFEEVKNMCEALEELMKDELDARENKGKEQVNELNLKLSALGRTDDIIKAASNPAYQKQLFEEFGL